MSIIVSSLVFTALLPLLILVAAARVVYGFIRIAWCEMGRDLMEWLLS